MKKIIFIKFGGSLITDKTKPNSVNMDKIKNLSSQIKEILNKDKNISVIIATGAGSFGHPVAKKYKNNLEKGLPHIKKAVKKLNNLVVTSLINIGLKAVSVEPSKIAEYKNGQMMELSHGYIVSLLKKNIVPVFHADLIKDQTKGISILSMDKFLVESAIWLSKKNYKISQVIFAGTTNGVLDKNSKTIKQIDKKIFSEISDSFFKNKRIDVTGGMKQKVESCLQLAEFGVQSYIINGLTKNSLVKTVLKNKVKEWGVSVVKKAK